MYQWGKRHMGGLIDASWTALLAPFSIRLFETQLISLLFSYFRHSFSSPLPWENRVEEFYNRDIVANVDPIAGSLTADNSEVASYTQYPGVALIGETVGWSAFVWFLIFISIFRGKSIGARCILMVRGVILEKLAPLFPRSPPEI